LENEVGGKDVKVKEGKKRRRIENGREEVEEVEEVKRMEE